VRTALYRHFDASGTLLYVGISLNAFQRLAQHRADSHWFSQITRVEIEWLDSRSLALEAEANAITRELPRFNVQRARLPKDATVIAFPRTTAEYSFAIHHISSGRRDGNYFDEAEAREQLKWWRAEFPEDEFEFIAARCGDAHWPYGATDGAAALRPGDSGIWGRTA
jgi:excinuclease UvrABC nuclease subunit